MEDKGLYLASELLTDDQLGAGQKIVYGVMLTNADADGVCRMSARQIGNVCGMTHTAVQAARLKLCCLGYAELVPDTQRDYRIMKIRKRKEANNE